MLHLWFSIVYKYGKRARIHSDWNYWSLNSKHIISTLQTTINLFLIRRTLQLWTSRKSGLLKRIELDLFILLLLSGLVGEPDVADSWLRSYRGFTAVHYSWRLLSGAGTTECSQRASVSAGTEWQVGTEWTRKVILKKDVESCEHNTYCDRTVMNYCLKPLLFHSIKPVLLMQRSYSLSFVSQPHSAHHCIKWTITWEHDTSEVNINQMWHFYFHISDFIVSC